MLYKRLFMALWVLVSHTALGQLANLGVPFIKNYTRSEYAAGSQTWDIVQGDNGMMYFANNDGLLQYNGINWNVYPLPNNSILRSLEKGPDGILYVGGYNELGYYTTEPGGGATYHSFLDMLPEESRDFGDVWKIYQHPDGVIYQTFYQLFILRDDTITMVKAPNLFHFSFMVDGEYYVVDMKTGILRYAMGNLFPLKGAERLRGSEIWGILPYDGNLVFVTASQGLFIYDGNTIEPMNSPTNELLKKNQVYCTYQLPGHRILFGTIQNGVIITNDQLEMEQYVNKDDGMQNNTVLCAGVDFLDNVWLGTDLGIDYLELNLPVSTISERYNLSTGYAMEIRDQRVYFGTNQGLYSLSVEPDRMEPDQLPRLIEETKGQVWTLQSIDNELFCGHNNGTFIINGERADKISNVAGGWIYRTIPRHGNMLIGGTYTGLTLYKKEHGRWTFAKEYEGFNQSSREMEFDTDGTLWITHGYNGIYHIFFDDHYESITRVDFYSSADGKVPKYIYGLSHLSGELVFITSQGLLTYDPGSDTFTASPQWSSLFDGIAVVSVLTDKSGNIWYFTDNDAGVLRLGEDGNYINIQKPFRKLAGSFVSSFEMVYPYNDENVFFGTERGMVRYNPRITKSYNYSFDTYIISLRTMTPDSVYPFTQLKQQDLKLDFGSNEVDFLFSANDFENTDKMEFSTFLVGNDKEWSAWQSRNIRTYTNLFEGHYEFKVKARNIYGTVSEAPSITFTISPPWYRSIMAYIVYGILVLSLILLLMLLMRRRYHRARVRSIREQEDQFRKREEKLQREGLQAEKEIIRMRNEKLREGIKQKDKELANSTMQMLQKNEMLITLREELKTLADLIASDPHRHDIFRLVRGINREIDNENQWKLFETHFDSVHEEFLQRIKSEYPSLTPRELKLCAYLRMNISSKEISVLMNISTRGVEISRYRLRKKLGLNREVNLTDYILSF